MLLRNLSLYRFTTTLTALISLCGILFYSNSHAANNQYTDWQNPQYILKAFNEIALKNEYKTTDKRILKWQQPIRYRFHYHALKPNPLVEGLFTTHLSHLSEISHHPIHHSKKQQANLNIYFTNDQSYADVIKKYSGSNVKNLQRESNCMGTFRTNRKNEIVSGTIVLPLDHVYSRGLLVACIVEETTQLMGLPNDSDWVNPSIANDASKVELLTGLDYILLKLLYDPKLKPGMKSSESTAKLKQTIKELMQSGEVEHANRKVNQSGLYPLITN